MFGWGSSKYQHTGVSNRSELGAGTSPRIGRVGKAFEIGGGMTNAWLQTQLGLGGACSASLHRRMRTGMYGAVGRVIMDCRNPSIQRLTQRSPTLLRRIEIVFVQKPRLPT